MEIHCVFEDEAIVSLRKKVTTDSALRGVKLKCDPAYVGAMQMVVLARAVAGIYAPVLRSSPERAAALLNKFIEDVKDTAQYFDKLVSTPDTDAN